MTASGDRLVLLSLVQLRLPACRLREKATPMTAVMEQRPSSVNRMTPDAIPAQGVPVFIAITSSETAVTWPRGADTGDTSSDAEACNGIIRWYDPVTGRWLSNDPIGISGGLNQYVFCGNNPVNFTDPWGLAPGDLYGSPRAAATDAMKQFTTKNDWLERGGAIYSIKDKMGATKYSYTDAVKGGLRSLPNDRLGLDPKTGKYTSELYKIPADGSMQGYWHSHTGLDDFMQGNIGFSNPDLENIRRFSQGDFFVISVSSGSVTHHEKRVCGETGAKSTKEDFFNLNR